MITGFNTDISYSGVTYHVQTEDKGESNPIILSLVYVRGAILAAKRTSYAKDLENGLTEEQLQAMLEKQHRTILAVIKAGRIQELVDKLNKQAKAEEQEDTGSRPAPQTAPPAIVPPPIPVPPIPGQQKLEYQPVVPPPQPPPAQPPMQQSAAQTAAPTPAPMTGYRNSGSGYRHSGSIESGHNKGDSQPLFAEFDLDKIIFDYLQTDAQEEKLEIKLRGSTELYAGEAILLQIEVTRGGIQPLASVPVIVKIIGTAFKPQIYSGRTGPDGVAIMPVTLPNFTAGSAAIVVQTSSDMGEAEIKQLIRRR